MEAHVVSARQREKKNKTPRQGNTTDGKGTKSSSGNEIVRHLQVDASNSSSGKLGTLVKDTENMPGFNMGGNNVHTHFSVAEMTLANLNLTGWSPL